MPPIGHASVGGASDGNLAAAAGAINGDNGWREHKVWPLIK